MKPELSIIIVCWNIENLIAKAIESAFAQGVPAQEIIVIDNDSKDSSHEIISKFQSTRSCQFRVIKNENNIGLGLARNQGIDAAKGRYIAFLDGDDWFEPNALSQIVRLADEIEADVTVFNHQQVYSDGGIKKNRHTNVLRSGDRTDPEDRRDLIRNFNVAWNKLYRAEFLDRHALRFPSGLYEDVDFTHRALMLADKCAASDQVVINYRKDRPGSITNSHGASHMMAIDRFRSLLEFADAHQELCAPYRRELFERVVRNSLTMLSNKQKRLPEELHPEFLRQVKELLDQYDPHRQMRVRNANILVYNALRSGNFKVFKTVKKLNRLRLGGY